MQFLSWTAPTLAENLALDEALLLEAEAGGFGEVLRLWEWPTLAVVLGAAGKLGEEVREGHCLRDGVGIGRRSSGGGAVLLGPGCLIFSLVLSYERAEALTQINSSYRFILGKIQQALGPLVGEMELAGTSDLAIAGRKFSGNTQQRKRNFLLHHGTLLYTFGLEQVGHYLKHPPRQPDYRRNRDHADFLMNLPLSREVLEQQLREIWQAEKLCQEWPAQRVQQLAEEKYSQDSWVRRR